MTAAAFNRHELAHRASNGIEVWLFWTKVGQSLTVEVYDARSEEVFVLEVPRNRALDAFHHPFAYLAAAETREQAELSSVAA